MISDITTPPKAPALPGYNLQDGDQIMDYNGNIWEWNIEKNEWLYKGQIQSFNDVNDAEDGLVTPEVQHTLELIQELVDSGYNFGRFRLKTGADNPYFYFFYSSDDLIKFIPEGPSRLRIEVDSARLYQKLIRNPCIGPKGKQGTKGLKGRTGQAAAAEVFQSPDFGTDNTISINTSVASPIDTPISLRLFDSDESPMVEFVVPLNPTEPVEIIIDDETVSVVETNLDIQYDSIEETLTASIGFNNNVDGWIYKARQRGPDGDTGADGNPFLEIVPELLPDPTVHSTNAIVSLRKTGEDSVAYLDREIFESIVVSKLSATAGALPPAELLKAHYVSAEITTRSNKDIGRFDIAPYFEDSDIPALDMPSWTPPAGCGSRNRWSAFRYNWWDFTDIEYAFRIVPTKLPPEKCCEQDFFWCPNVGDEPCGVRGAIGRKPNIEMPKKFADECICECENPIEFELQSGGFVFDPLDTTDDAFEENSALVVAQDSVIDGSSDKFTLDVLIDQPVRIEARIEPRSEVCGGQKKERRGCAYRDGRKVHTTGVIQDLSGGAIFTSPQISEVEAFPGTLEYKVDTNKFTNSDGEDENIESKLRLVLNVNNTFINLCRGYRVTVAVFKDQSAAS
jgi:hypothetical protein